MNPDFRTWLTMLAEAEAVIPARVVLARLPVDDTPAPPEVADPTIEDVARELGRAPSTVRGWRLAGEFPGAYQLGREWRIPRADIRAFLDRQKPTPAIPSATLPVSETKPDLGDWRHHVRGG